VSDQRQQALELTDEEHAVHHMEEQLQHGRPCRGLPRGTLMRIGWIGTRAGASLSRTAKCLLRDSLVDR
jgi:hypothetical protein